MKTAQNMPIHNYSQMYKLMYTYTGIDGGSYFVEKGYEVHHGFRDVHGGGGVSVRLELLKGNRHGEDGTLYIHIYTYTHTHIYIYIYTYINIYVSL
jgi:hypothetical protein